MAKQHKPGCPRLQFWDAGQFEAPCECDDIEPEDEQDEPQRAKGFNLSEFLDWADEQLEGGPVQINREVIEGKREPEQEQRDDPPASWMLNDDQKSYFRYLNSLSAEAKCDCGWYEKGKCPQPICQMVCDLFDGLVKERDFVAKACEIANNRANRLEQQHLETIAERNNLDYENTSLINGVEDMKAEIARLKAERDSPQRDAGCDDRLEMARNDILLLRRLIARLPLTEYKASDALQAWYDEMKEVMEQTNRRLPLLAPEQDDELEKLLDDYARAHEEYMIDDCENHGHNEEALRDKCAAAREALRTYVKDIRSKEAGAIHAVQDANHTLVLQTEKLAKAEAERDSRYSEEQLEEAHYKGYKLGLSEVVVTGYSEAGVREMLVRAQQMAAGMSDDELPWAETNADRILGEHREGR